MKILHINCNYLITPLHQLLIEKLGEAGIENKVFVPIYIGAERNTEVNGDVSVSVCFKERDRYLFDYKQHKIIKALETSADISKFDVIHAYTVFTDGNCAMKMSKKYGKPYVVAVRNTDLNLFLKKLVYLRARGIKILRGAKKIFFLSEAYKNELFEKYVPEKYKSELLSKTEIIPNGIDDFWISNVSSKSGFDASNIRLIYAGRIDANKNISTTQSAMKILREKGINTSLTVVGKVADEAIYNELRADSFTSFYPAVPKEQLISYYRNNDIFVMPSRHETFGLVYAEAMSQGIPVVYTKGQGFDKQFPDGTVGFSVSSSSAEDVASSIEKIIGNYSAISENCVQNCKKYVWKDIAARYLEIYGSLAK